MSFLFQCDNPYCHNVVEVDHGKYPPLVLCLSRREGAQALGPWVCSHSCKRPALDHYMKQSKWQEIRQDEPEDTPMTLTDEMADRKDPVHPDWHTRAGRLHPTDREDNQ